MSLLLDIEQNLPSPLIQQISASKNIPVHRAGDFYERKTGPGCGTTCIWNGGGYYMEHFVCGQTYPSGMTFYCCSDCHEKVGDSKKVFLSYRWRDLEHANKLEGCLKGAGIEVLRDVNEIEFLDVISQFMAEASASRYFVGVMTETYFRSRYCMYEFCQLVESDLPIRTIPIMLGDESQPDIDEQRLAYWRGKHDELAHAIQGIDPRYTNYLQNELDLLKKIPVHLAEFFAVWRAKERPEGKHWMMVNCLYLVGAIKTTFRPSEEDATNWTYKGQAKPWERTDDGPRGQLWNPQPFHLHAASEKAAQTIMDCPRARELVLDTHIEDTSLKDLPSGVHLVLVDEAALSSLRFCMRVLRLLETDDVTVIPMILDEPLQHPAGELPVLRKWNDRLAAAESEHNRKEIDAMLVRFGPMVERLRDTLVPGVSVTFRESS